ncbi:hypothetical protein ACIOEX_26280 [Streptomyces sp. NPDC087850]|uniref:hypothetical protein n=1 Tax=Streptomyces sp. NPDC087850 TaxID=3365809 RepID=UPI0037FF2E37
MGPFDGRFADARELCVHAKQELAAAAARNAFVDLVETGGAPRKRLLSLVAEESLIVRSDRRGFALAASRFGADDAAAELFLGLAQGETRAVELLARLRSALDRMPADDGPPPEGADGWRPSPMAQGYPHYLGWLVAFGTRSELALALLVNFGFWGGYCARLADALPRRYGLTAADVEFFTFFSTLPPGFEEQAGRFLQSGLDAGEDPSAALEATRIMQAYEAAFWQSLAQGEKTP